MQLKRRCKTCMFETVLQDKEEKAWAPEEVERLIDYYRDNEELWNHKLGEYRDRQLKELNLKSLSILLPGRRIDEIKKEWTNLKTIFSREVKREEGSKVSGTGTDSVYSSSWRYFKSTVCCSSKGVNPAKQLQQHAFVVVMLPSWSHTRQIRQSVRCISSTRNKCFCCATSWSRKVKKAKHRPKT